MIDSELAKITAQVDLNRYRRDLIDFIKVKNAEQAIKDKESSASNEEYKETCKKWIIALRSRLNDTRAIVYAYFNFKTTPTESVSLSSITFFLKARRLTESDFIKAVAKRGYIIKSDFKFKTL